MHSPSSDFDFFLAAHLVVLSPPSACLLQGLLRIEAFTQCGDVCAQQAVWAHLGVLHQQEGGKLLGDCYMHGHGVGLGGMRTSPNQTVQPYLCRQL